MQPVKRTEAITSLQKELERSKKLTNFMSERLSTHEMQEAERLLSQHLKTQM